MLECDVVRRVRWQPLGLPCNNTQCRQAITTYSAAISLLSVLHAWDPTGILRSWLDIQETTRAIFAFLWVLCSHRLPQTFNNEFKFLIILDILFWYVDKVSILHKQKETKRWCKPDQLCGLELGAAPQAAPLLTVEGNYSNWTDFSPPPRKRPPVAVPPSRFKLLAIAPFININSLQ